MFSTSHGSVCTETKEAASNHLRLFTLILFNVKVITGSLPENFFQAGHKENKRKKVECFPVHESPSVAPEYPERK